MDLLEVHKSMPSKARQALVELCLSLHSYPWNSLIWAEGEQKVPSGTKKDLKNPTLDLSFFIWQKIRLILKLNYGFGSSPRLRGHHARTQFQNTSWPAVSCPSFPQEHTGLLSCLYNQNAWELCQTPSGIFWSYFEFISWWKWKQITGSVNISFFGGFLQN